MKNNFPNMFLAVLFIFLAGFYTGSRQAGAEVIKEGSVNAIVSISGEGRLYIGEGIEVIKDNVFHGEKGNALVTEIEVSPENQFFSSKDGVLYSKDKKELLYYPNAKTGESFTIDNNVETISQYAFYNNQNLKSLSLGEGIKEFPLEAVYGCKKLEKLKLSASTEKVVLDGIDYARGGFLDNLQEVEVPEENQYLRGYSGALYSEDYRKLYYILALDRKNITIHKNCTQILNVPGRNKIQSVEAAKGNQKFSSYEGVLYDKSLTRIVLFPGLKQSYNMPDTVKDVSILGKKAYLSGYESGFDRYYIMACSLKNITVNKDNPYFTADGNVLYNKKMTELVLFPEKREGSYEMPEGTSVGDYGVFAGADRLSSLVVSTNVSLSFYGCTSLEKVVYNDNVESVIMFESNNTGIKEIYLPASLVYIRVPYYDFKNVIFYGYKNTGGHTYEEDLEDLEEYITKRKYKFKSFGTAPAKTSYADAALKGNILKVSWKKASGSDGYRISYNTGTYPWHEETVKEINGGSKTSCTVNMQGLYGETGIYIRAYKNINGVKVYGMEYSLGLEKFFKYSRPADAGIKPEVYGNMLESANGYGKLYIDRNIKRIYEKDIFNQADSEITEIEVSPENRYFSSRNGVLYNKDQTVLISYPVLKEGESFKIPGTVEIISDFAFAYNKNLNNITIGNNTKTIKDYAFMESNIESISIPGTVENTGRLLFDGCSKLQKAEWGSTNEIPEWTFRGCKSLKSFEVPGTVEKIGYSAFEDCGSVEIKIGSNVTSIDSYAFCKSASNFKIDERNQDFKVTDGVLYSADGKELIAYPAGKKGDYVMPEALCSINRCNFMGNKYLTGLVLNKNIKKFDLFYLDGCDNFEKLVLSENTEKLAAGRSKSGAYTDTVLENAGLGFYLKNFKEIEVPEGNKYFKIYDGNLYSGDYKELYYIFTDGKDRLSIHKDCEIISYNFGRNSFKEINVPESNKKFTSLDGVLYNKNITKIILFPGMATSYNVPATVSDISAIKKWYSKKNLGFTKYNIMAASLEEITADKDSPYFTAKDNVLYNKKGTKLILFPQKRKGKYIMPANVSIENMAVFAEASEMTGIEISCNGTFYAGGCTSLKEITCKEGVKEFILKDKTCYNSNKSSDEKLLLKKIVLPSTLKRMGIETTGIEKNIVIYGYNNTCGEFSDISNSLVLENINDVKTYVKDKGYQYKSLGTAPGSVKGVKAVKKGNKVNISWKTPGNAEGYRITYIPDDSRHLEEIVLENIKGGKKTLCSIKKSRLGGIKTVYISAYKKINGIKVYGKSTKAYV